jgi:hypothetical protein
MIWEREEKRNALPWLHIWPQPLYHEEAVIEGTRAALTNLRDALSRLLETGQDQRSEAMAADGEGYHVTVRGRSFAALAVGELPYSEKL